MAALFQDESEEPAPASPLHVEGEEPASNEPCGLFCDEPDEPEAPLAPKNQQAGPDRGLEVLGVEREEDDEHELFGDEPGESDNSAGYVSDGSEVARFHGDLDEDRNNLVQLSFSTLSTFLSTQLCNTSSSSVPEPARKKRCYNNRKRLAAAMKRKQEEGERATRQKRNSPDPCIEPLRDAFQIWALCLQLSVSYETFVQGTGG